jgi:acylphosphatase
MKVKVHVLISGRVQGVFFRIETRNMAKRKNVFGWVRNNSDGTVEAIFEGAKKDVEKLVEFCRRGPPGARVTNVKVQWEEYTGEFNDFKIQSRHFF